MDERHDPLGAIAIKQAPDLAGRALQDATRLLDRQLTGEDMVQDI